MQYNRSQKLFFFFSFQLLNKHTKYFYYIYFTEENKKPNNKSEERCVCDVNSRNSLRELLLTIRSVVGSLSLHKWVCSVSGFVLLRIRSKWEKGKTLTELT